MLVTQTDILKDVDVLPWHRQVLQDLTARLMPPSKFPCTFSQNAIRRQTLAFSFVEDLSEAARAQASQDIADYVALSRTWDGRINSAVPLVMAFSQQAARFDDLPGYQAFGWSMLQDLHARDPQPWPQDVTRDAQAPFWSFCHSGMQLFVNMSAPSHIQRTSRNLGQHFQFVVNPRERFDIVAGDTPEGNRVRAQIRRRCADYDGQPHAPELGSYMKGELEGPQYALPDSNGGPVVACPFQVKPA